MGALRSGYVDESCQATGREYGEHYVQLLENEDHAKEYSLGLIPIDVRVVPGRVGWRSIHAIRGVGFYHHL